MAEPIKLDYVPEPIQANTGLGNSKQPIQLDYVPEPIAPVQPTPKGLGTVVRGVQAGGYETLGTLGGLTAMGGEALGLPEVQKAGLKYAGEQFQKAEELGQGIPTRVEDIKNVGDALQFGLYTGGSILPSVALSATGAGLGVAGTKELAKKGIKEQVYKKLDEQIAKKEAKGKLLSNEEKALLTAKADKVIAKKLDKVSGLGGTAGIAATSIPQEVGSVYAEQAQEGKTDVGAALTSGVAAGLLDTFSAHKMLSKFGLLGGKNLEANRTRAKSLLGAVIKGGATQAGIEGLTEGAQTFIEKLGVKYANPNLSLTDKNAILDYLNSTIAGSIGGGTFGGLGGGLSYKSATDLTGGKPLTEAPAQPTAPQAPQPQIPEQPAQPQIATGAIHPQQSVSIVTEHPPSVTPDGRTIQTPASITAVKDKSTLQIGQKVRIGKGKGLNEEGYVAQIQPDGTIVYTATPEEAQQYAAQQQQPTPTTVQPSAGLVMSAPTKAPVMGQVGGLAPAQRPSKPIPSLRGEELRATPTKQEPAKEPSAKENPELKKKFDTVKNLRARYDSQPNEFHGKALLRSIRELYNTKGISEPQKELYSKLYNEIQDEVISNIKTKTPKRKFGTKEFPPISGEAQAIEKEVPAAEPTSLTKEPTPATMKEPTTEKGAGVEKYIAKEDNPVFMDWQKRQEIVRKAESGEELTPEEAASFGYTHDKAGLYNTTAYKRWVRQDKNIEKQPHLYMDLDNFKKYNDEYGHDFGDTLIKYVGERLSKISPTDKILGLGGDEFAAVHPDADVLNNIAEGLKKDLSNAKFEIKNLKTGKIDIVKGLKLSHGVGKDFRDAKEVTSKEKEAKLLTGERYVRGAERRGAEFRKPQGAERPTREEGRVPDNGDNITGREKIPSRQATTEVGSPSTVTTPAGREIETVFIIKDINDVIPSHLAEGFPNPPVNPEYKGELQPRDRSKEAWLSVEEQSKKIDPRRMGDSPEASLGAPIIGKDNLVESGNGRTIALALAYKNNAADNYKKYLIDNAEKFGLTKEQIEAINEPILVRERQTKLSLAERKTFVEEANEATISGKKTTEEAKIDASRLSTLDKLDINEDGTFPRGSGFAKDFIEHVVPRNDRPQMSVEGELTQYGLRRIQNAIFAKAYGYNNITQKMMESTDNNIKNITNGMLKAAPDIAKLQADMEKGKLNEKLDIIPQLIKAINTYSSEIQSKNISYDQYSKQLDMFEKPSQDELDMVKSIYDRRKSGVQIADMLKLWVERVEAEGNPRQSGLALEETKPINKFDLFREVLGKLSGVKGQDIFARIAKGGMDKSELEKELEPLLALNKKRNLETKVLQSVEDLAMELPENGQRKVENLGGDISGFIYGHKIFIIADNIRSVKEGYKTLNHEVAHFGLRQVLNDKEFDRLLRQVWIARNEDAKDIAELYKLDITTEKGRLEAAEEVLAHLAENDANNTWVQKAVAIIARWLREHGIDIKLTDSEIREILMAAKHYDTHIRDRDKYSSLTDGRFQIIAYHGTDGAFQEFDDRYISRNNALGYGFYFTDKKEITRKYGENLFDVILHEGKTPDQYDYIEYYQPISKQQASKIVDTANTYGIKEDMMARRLKRGVDLPTGEEVYRWLEEVGQANGIRDPFSWVPVFLTRAGIDGTVDTEPGRTVWCVFNSSNISIKNISKGVSGGRASLIGRTGAQELSSAHIANLETAKKMEREGAKNTAIYFATGWEKGVDGEWRMELDTDNLSLKYPFPNDGQVVSISDLIKFPELFKAYPNLRDMKVEFNQNILDEGNLAEFDPAENKINLSPALKNNLRNLKSTLLHEMQHWIQGEEGFALGTNITEAKDLLKASKKELKGLKPDEVYARAAGEVEARNIETRAGMLTAEERKQIPPSMTEDRKREQQLISRSIAPEIPDAKKLVEPTIEDEAYKQQNKVIKMARMSANTFPTDEGYKRVLEIEAQRNNVNEFLKNVSNGIDDASRFLGKFFSGIDESLGYIDERLKWRLRRFENTYRQGLTRDTTEIKPFLKALSLMKEGTAMRMENGKEKKVKVVPNSKKGMEDYLVLDFALKNGDMAKINEIVKKYGIEDEYKAIKPILKNLLEKAKEVGYEFGEIENYFPRAVKDPKGLVQHLRQMDGWSIIDKNIDEKSKTLGRNLTDEEILDVVATTLRGYKTGVSLPQLSNMKKRLYGKLKPDMNQYYHTAETSLMAYLERTHEGIATREFFGKANVKEGGVKDSIDQYVQQLRKEGKLSPSQEKEVIEILNSRFNYRQMNPFLSGYRNLEYIDTMGSPISAVTQIGDLAFSIYFNGHYTGRALFDAVTNKERVTKYKAGIENITNEFTGQHNKMARAVNVVFKLVGLEKMDAIGKETFMNSTVAKYRAMAKNPTKEFMDELELIMGNKKDAGQLLKDLQESKLTPLTETFAVLKLMDVQPLTLSQMPLKYIDSPNGRIFYMLKSYTIKQFNVFRKQCFDLIYEGSRLSASKDPKEKAKGQKMLLEGTKRMIALTSTLVFMGITTDFIKDWMLGRETEWDDKVINNLFRLVGLSKYTYFQAKQEGTSKALLMTILPPAKLLDNITKDSFEQKGIDKTIQSVPLVGSMFYWWMKHFREQ